MTSLCGPILECIASSVIHECNICYPHQGMAAELGQGDSDREQEILMKFFKVLALA